MAIYRGFSSALILVMKKPSSLIREISTFVTLRSFPLRSAITRPGLDRRKAVPPRKRRAAIGSWAAMVGALILARMSADSELSDEVLSETRAWLTAQNRKKTKTR